MKKLLTLLPLSVVLAACATSSPTPSSTPVLETTSATTEIQNTDADTDTAYDRKAPEQFVCEDDANVNVKYSLDGQEAELTASLPKANWNNQSRTMHIAPSGSGARYINDDNSNVTYEWHSKSDFGIMSLQWADGDTYSVNCKKI